jgi:outer membrane protein assembly factor BamB
MIAALVLACLAQDSDWPGFLGPNRDGTSPERGLPLKWPAAGPKVLWSRELGEGHATCSVAAGRAYVYDRHGDQARLACLDARTGAELWRFEHATGYEDGYGAGPGPRCVPVVDGDRVYVFGPEGLLHCVRTADGAPVWKRDTTRDFGVVQNFFGVGSTPLVEGGLLVAMVGGSPPGSPDVASGELRGNGSGIVAFDKRTGETKYRITDELASYASPVAATIGGRRWCFVYARGGLVGFEPATGKVDFEYPWRVKLVQSVNIASPVVAGDLVLVSEAYGIGSSVLRVRPGGYDVVWSDGRKRDRALSAYWNTPVHVDGHVYGAEGMSSDGELRCVELATGKLKWSDRRVPQSSLLRVDGHFVALGERGALRLLKATPEGCEILAEATLRSADGKPLLEPPARAAPVLSRGLLYVRGRDRLVCVELVPPRDEHPLPAERREKMKRDLEERDRALTELLAADPKSVEALSRRGDVRFMQARFAEAVADYEKMVVLDPKLEAGHWRRGIAWFYAGEPAKAAHQFEIYHTHDDVDRENGIWRFLSQAKAHGFEKARAGLLKYAKDDREPFPAVYQLFEGKLKPGEVLAGIREAKIGDEEREKRLFYAELYVGLLAAVEGRAADAERHLRAAVANSWGPDSGFGPAWMWHVGRVHYEQLRAGK